MHAVATADAGPITRSKALDESLARAHQLAVAQSHASVALEHLLFALQDDPDGQSILTASGIQRDRLAADVSAYLGRLSEAHQLTGSPQPGPDLLRILQLAAMAARQSQRRQIDGGIVLAAIIGDGNSPAAGMLKAQGLTFEAVIRAISQTPARTLDPPPTAAALPAPQSSVAPTAMAPSSVSGLAPGTGPGPGPGPSVTAELSAARIARVSDAVSANSVLATARERVKKSEPQTIPIKTARPAPVAEAQPPTAVSYEPAGPERRVDEPASVATTPSKALPTRADNSMAAAPALPTAQPFATEHVSTPAGPAPAAAVPVSNPPALTLAELRRPRSNAPVPPPPLERQSSSVLSSQQEPAALSAQPAMPTPAADPSSALPQHARPLAPPPPPVPLSDPQPAAPRPTSAQQATATASLPIAHLHPGQLLGAPQTSFAQPVIRSAPLPPHAHEAMPLPPQPGTHPGQPTPPLALTPSVAVDIVSAAAGLPAFLRIGIPTLVEVRIPRDQIDVPRRRGPSALGRNSEVPIYRVVSVRLGTGGISGIAVEPRSPETVWIGMGRDFDTHEFIWQFVVTPTRQGRFAVTLSVSGRTVSPYGVSGDDTPQSETFAVHVRRATGGRFKRVLVALALIGVGAATAIWAGGPIAALTKSLLTHLLK